MERGLGPELPRIRSVVNRPARGRGDVVEGWRLPAARDRGAHRRAGRFVALDQHVVTSGRKLRTHSGREILAAALRPLWKGRAAYRAREGLEVWYGERRDDPGERAA